MRKLLLLLLVASSTYAQSVRFQSQAISSRGLPLANQTVAVCTQPANTGTQPCSPLAVLGTSTSTTSGGVNPLTTDANGNYFFYLPQNTGKVTVQIYGPSINTPFVQPDVVVPTDLSNPLVINNVNGMVLIDGVKYACSDVGINAAIASLNTVSTWGPHTVDARGCQSITVGSTIIVGTNTGVSSEAVQLLLPCSATVSVTATGGVHVFQMADESELVGCGKTGTHVTVASTANIADVVSFIGNPANNSITERARIRGLNIAGNASATITNGLLNMQNAYDTTVQDTALANAAPCLLFIADTNASIAPNANDFENVLLDGQYTANTVLVCITSKNGGNVGPTRFRGGDWGHPGTGKPLLQVNRSGAGTTHTFGISISDLYVESHNTDLTTALFSVADTISFSLNNVWMNRLNASSTAPCITFSDTTSLTGQENLRNVTCTGGSNLNAITSSVSGIPALPVSYVANYWGQGAGPANQGSVVIGSTVFANLGTPANGTFLFCSDCTIANPCAGSGTGALAKRLNGVWVCN